MKKSTIFRTGFLVLIFIAALFLFEFITNKNNPDMNLDMGMARLPGISFVVEDQEMNHLPGYISDMEITSMRDTITPVSNQNLDVIIQPYESKVEGMDWELLTLDGEKCLQDGKIDEVADKVNIQFENGILREEGVLKITLHIEEGDVYYYTRVKSSSECYLKENMEFVKYFHQAAMDKSDNETLATYLENGDSLTENGLQNVDIFSDVEKVSWGSTEPVVVSTPHWEVKEINKAYTSILLTYRVRLTASSSSELAEYSVREFFKVGTWNDKQYLSDYERSMEQYLDVLGKIVDDKGINLGIVPDNLEYKVDPEGKWVSFIQNDELWNYDKESGEFALLFGFANTETGDDRHFYDRHEIHIISLEKNGDTAFSVCGYMNRGVHEGEVGVAVYRYDAEKRALNEIVFIPTVKGYDIMKDDLGKFVYYSKHSEKLYVMMAGTLYCVNLEEDTREVLVHGLEKGQYVVSDDSHLIAYQEMGGKLYESDKIAVMDLVNGRTFYVEAPEGEFIRPIGFVKDDFAYGTFRVEDSGQMATGEVVYPMYQVDIVNQAGSIVKTYNVPDIFIDEAYIEDNLLTLERVVNGGGSYIDTDPDFITNNAEEDEEKVTLKTKGDEIRNTVTRLEFKGGLDKTDYGIYYVRQVQDKKPIRLTFDELSLEGRYYVYARGQLQGTYEQVSDAMEAARTTGGTAVTSSQHYIAEEGYLPTVYEVDRCDPFTAQEGESTLNACLRYVLEKEDKQVDVSALREEGKTSVEVLDSTGGEGLNLTGCTLKDVLYLVSRETPVIALTGEDQAVLIIGYNKEKVAYLDPWDGARYSVSKEEMESMVQGYAGAFIGYTK